MNLFSVGEFGDALAILKAYGPSILVIAFVFWRDWRREDRLTARIEGLEKEHREIVLPLVKECSGVVTQCAGVIDHNSTVIERLERRMDL